MTGTTAVWVLFSYLQLQATWLPMPLNVATQVECQQLGQQLVDISQKTTKNVNEFFCTQVSEDDAQKILAKMGSDDGSGDDNDADDDSSSF